MSSYVQTFKNLVNAMDNDKDFDNLTEDDKARILANLMDVIDSHAKEARKAIKSSKFYKGRYSFKKGEYIK